MNALLLAVLYLAGVALVTAEFFLPGGVLGVLGATLFIGVVITTGALFPEYALLVIPLQLVGGLVGVAGGFWMLAHTPLGRAIRNDHNQDPALGYTNMTSDLSLIGKHGTVLTALRPAGTIVVGGERYDAVSDGAFIAKDSTVIIREVHGNRIVVEASAPAAEVPQA